MNLLTFIGFNSNTISLFRDSINYDNVSKVIFDYHKAFFKPTFKKEILTITRQQLIPADFFNIVNPLNSELIVEAYFFNSFTDAMAFYQLKNFINFNNSLFIITGNNPQYSYVAYLQDNYLSLKKYHLVYPNSFLGRMLDVKLACYLSDNNNVSFILKDNILTVYYDTQSVSINRNNFSLGMIRKALNITFPYKTFKSKLADSYFDELTFNKII